MSLPLPEPAVARPRGGHARLVAGALLLLFVLPALRAQEPPERTPEEIEWASDLALRRKLQREKLEKKAKKKNPAWRLEPTRGFHVLVSKGLRNSGGAKHSKNCSAALRKWWMRAFGPLYVKKPGKTILRLSAGGKAAFIPAEEAVEVNVGVGYSITGTFHDLARYLPQHYLHLRHPGLVASIPPWLQTGLDGLAKVAAQTKRFGFIFKIPTHDVRAGQKIILQRRMMLVEDILGKPMEEVIEGRVNGQNDYRVMSLLLVRYLTYGRGAKGRTKGILGRYLDKAAFGLEVQEARWWGKKLAELGEEATTEQVDKAFLEFDARMTRAWSRTGSAAQEVYRKAFEDVFGSWKATDWKKLQSAFAKYVIAGAPL